MAAQADYDAECLALRGTQSAGGNLNKYKIMTHQSCGHGAMGLRECTVSSAGRGKYVGGHCRSGL